LTVPIAGEPNRYSATVIRTLDDGTKREVSTSREFRSGELRREEWTEEGRHLALIWLPDPGKAFLLDLDAKTYQEVESDSGERDTLNKRRAAFLGCGRNVRRPGRRVRGDVSTGSSGSWH
jgi:hypothetical protein